MLITCKSGFHACARVKLRISNCIEGHNVDIAVQHVLTNMAFDLPDRGWAGNSRRQLPYCLYLSLCHFTWYLHSSSLFLYSRLSSMSVLSCDTWLMPTVRGITWTQSCQRCHMPLLSWWHVLLLPFLEAVFRISWQVHRILLYVFCTFKWESSF